MAETGREAGFQRLIGFDMGGTSTDVSHFDGEYENSYSQVIGELNTSGRPNGGQYRAHNAHGPRGTHTGRQSNSHETTSTVATREENGADGFGAGIL